MHHGGVAGEGTQPQCRGGQGRRERRRMAHTGTQPAPAPWHKFAQHRVGLRGHDKMLGRSWGLRNPSVHAVGNMSAPGVGNTFGSKEGTS